MNYTLGPIAQHGEASFSFRFTCPTMTEHQFRFLNDCLDDVADDTYPNIDGRTTLVFFSGEHISRNGFKTPNAFRDHIENDHIDKFIRRCCNPKSELYISASEYELIEADNE